MTCELNGDHGNAVATVDDTNGTVHMCIDCAFTARDAGLTVEPWARYFES